jgi:hypothetical protein
MITFWVLAGTAEYCNDVNYIGEMQGTQMGGEMQGKASVLAAFLTGVGVAATVVYVMKKRGDQPDRQLSGIRSSCDHALRTLERRIRVSAAHAG